MSTRIWTDKKGSSLRLQWNYEGKRYQLDSAVSLDKTRFAVLGEVFLTRRSLITTASANFTDGNFLMFRPTRSKSLAIVV